MCVCVCVCLCVCVCVCLEGSNSKAGVCLKYRSDNNSARGNLY